VGVTADFYDYLVARARRDLHTPPSPTPAPAVVDRLVPPAPRPRIPGLGVDPAHAVHSARLPSLDPTLDRITSSLWGAEHQIELIETLLSPNEAGVPVKGMSIWDFVARVDLDEAPVTWRDQHEKLLKSAQAPAVRKLIRDRALDKLANAKTILKSPRYTRVGVRGGDPTRFLSRQSVAARLIDDAVGAVHRWFDDPKALATLSFALRMPSGDEYAEHVDEINADLVWTVDRRRKEVRPKATSNDALIRRSRVSTPGLTEMQRLASKHMPEMARHILGEGASANQLRKLAVKLAKMKLRPIAPPSGGYGTKALLLEGTRADAKIGFDAAFTFTKDGRLFGLVHEGGSEIQFVAPDTTVEETRVEMIKHSVGELSGWVADALAKHTNTALTDSTRGALRKGLDNAHYKKAKVPDGSKHKHAYALILDGVETPKNLLVMTARDGTVADIRVELGSKTYDLASLGVTPAEPFRIVPKGTHSVTVRGSSYTDLPSIDRRYRAGSTSEELLVKGIVGDKLLVDLRGEVLWLKPVAGPSFGSQSWRFDGGMPWGRWAGSLRVDATAVEGKLSLRFESFEATRDGSGTRRIMSGEKVFRTKSNKPPERSRFRVQQIAVKNPEHYCSCARHRPKPEAAQWPKTVQFKLRFESDGGAPTAVNIDGKRVKLRKVKRDGKEVVTGRATFEIPQLGKRTVVVDIDPKERWGTRNVQLSWTRDEKPDKEYQYTKMFVQRRFRMTPAAG